MPKTTDDLEAVRIIVDALEGFDPNDEQRIFRWAAEKLGLPQPFGATGLAAGHGVSLLSPAGQGDRPSPLAPASGTVRDIRSFIASKKPRSDIQFAAAVAYYYQFEAPEPQRKSAINKDDLQDACRKAGRKRLVNPRATLNNARFLGLLDKAEEAGAFSINSVGENLVAMTLPGNGDSNGGPEKRPSRRNAAKQPTEAKTFAKKATKA